MRWCGLLFLYLLSAAVVADDGQKAEVYYNSGIAYYKQGNFEKANIAFQAALAKIKSEKKPNPELEAKIQYNLGNTHFRLNGLHAASSCYRESLAINSSDKDAAYNLDLTLDLIAKAAKEKNPIVQTPAVTEEKEISREELKRLLESVDSEKLLKPAKSSEQIIAAHQAVVEREKVELTNGLEKKIKSDRLEIEKLEAELRAETEKEEAEKHKEEQAIRLDQMAKTQQQNEANWHRVKQTASNDSSSEEKSKSTVGDGDPELKTNVAKDMTERDPIPASTKDRRKEFEKLTEFTVFPGDEGRFQTAGHNHYDLLRSSWSRTGRNATDLTPKFDAVSTNSYKLQGKISPAEMIGVKIPLVVRDGYSVDPDSFRFESDQIGSYQLTEDSVGTMSLRITSKANDPKGTAPPPGSSWFSYQLRHPLQLKPSPLLPSDSKKFAGKLPLQIKKDLDRLFATARNDKEKSEILEAYIIENGIYTKNDDEMDHYLNADSPNESKFDRMAKVFLKDPSLPPKLKDKGMDCDMWSEFYIAIAREYGLPSRLILGFQNNGDSALTTKEYHGWVRTWISEQNQWLELNPTPSSKSKNIAKLRLEIANRRLALTEMAKTFQNISYSNKSAIHSDIAAMEYREELIEAEAEWRKALTRAEIEIARIDQKKNPSKDDLLLKQKAQNLKIQAFAKLKEAAANPPAPSPQFEAVEARHQLSVLENLIDLNPIDESGEYRKLIQTFGGRTNQIVAENELYKTIAENDQFQIVIAKKKLYLRSKQSLTLKSLNFDVSRYTDFPLADLTTDGNHYAFLARRSDGHYDIVRDGKIFPTPTDRVFDLILSDDGQDLYLHSQTAMTEEGKKYYRTKSDDNFVFFRNRDEVRVNDAYITKIHKFGNKIVVTAYRYNPDYNPDLRETDVNWRIRTRFIENDVDILDPLTGKILFTEPLYYKVVGSKTGDVVIGYSTIESRQLENILINGKRALSNFDLFKISQTGAKGILIEASHTADPEKVELFVLKDGKLSKAPANEFIKGPIRRFTRTPQDSFEFIEEASGIKRELQFSDGRKVVLRSPIHPDSNCDYVWFEVPTAYEPREIPEAVEEGLYRLQPSTGVIEKVPIKDELGNPLNLIAISWVKVNEVNGHLSYTLNGLKDGIIYTIRDGTIIDKQLDAGLESDYRGRKYSMGLATIARNKSTHALTSNFSFDTKHPAYRLDGYYLGSASHDNLGSASAFESENYSSFHTSLGNYTLIPTGDTKKLAQTLPLKLIIPDDSDFGEKMRSILASPEITTEQTTFIIKNHLYRMNRDQKSNLDFSSAQKLIRENALKLPSLDMQKQMKAQAILSLFGENYSAKPLSDAELGELAKNILSAKIGVEVLGALNENKNGLKLILPNNAATEARRKLAALISQMDGDLKKL